MMKKIIIKLQDRKHKASKMHSLHFWPLVFMILFFTVVQNSKGQEYLYYTQYMFNGMAINPAYASVHDFIGITGNIRQQWVGMDGAPSSQTISGFSPILNKQFGLGVNIVNDRVGSRSQQEVSINYAYKILFPDFSLSLGLKLGFNTIQNRFNELYLDDEDDVNFLDNSTAFLPIVGIGAYLKARNYYIGLSVPQLYRFAGENHKEYQIEQQSMILLTGGYLYRINRDFKIRPSVFTKTQIGGVFEMDVNTNLYYKDDYCIGLTYKSLNSLAIIMEIGINKMYYIGYSYDIATSQMINYQAGTHEFSLNVYINRRDRTRIVNPRYF